MCRPMKWSELRKRLAACVNTYNPEGQKLLADVDAAAPAMERQERVIKVAREYGASYLMTTLLPPKDGCPSGMNPKFWNFLQAAIRLAREDANDDDA